MQFNLRQMLAWTFLAGVALYISIQLSIWSRLDSVLNKSFYPCFLEGYVIVTKLQFIRYTNEKNFVALLIGITAGFVQWFIIGITVEVLYKIIRGKQ